MSPFTLTRRISFAAEESVMTSLGWVGMLELLVEELVLLVEEVEDVEEDELVELLDSGGSEVSPLPLVDSTGSGVLSELIGVLVDELCGVEVLST